MSLRVVLGFSLAVMLICPNWSAAAESKAKGSSVASDRQATPARVARKEAADDERPRKARAQKDDSDDKEPARKTRAKKDDSDDDAPARKARAKKDDSDDDDAPARKAWAKKNDDDEVSAQKTRAKKDEASAQKARAKKNDSDDDAPARKARAQKETSQKDSDGQSETLAALKQQVRDLRKQVADMERLRAELAAVKAQVRGTARAAAEQAADNQVLAALKQQLRDLLKQVADTERLRTELADIKAQVRRSAPKVAIWGGVPLTLPPALSAPPSGNPVIEMATLRIPDVRDDGTPPLQPPVNPATASLPAVIREQLPATRPPKSAVEEAKAYLVKTATPGGTMMRQGVSVAIDRLHPGFAVKLAEAVKRARDEGLTEAGVFSAYRPPAFGIGGFADKFDSLHSYGLATDITGIGGPGSASAHRWHQIVMDVGLYLPYGPDHRVEFNHTQFIPVKVAPRELRETITADGPIDLRQMWLASGVDVYVTEPPAVALARSPGSDASAEAAAGEPDPAAKPAAAEPTAPAPNAPQPLRMKRKRRSRRRRRSQRDTEARCHPVR
jgi:chemotaxis protein histidine kinase CheA